ncbi:sensor histidine kinase, partial [Nonomuraea fuscirosea]
MSSVHAWRPVAVDGALAVVVAVLQSATVLTNPGAGALDLAAVLVASAALVAWRRAPLFPLLVSTLGMIVYAAHAQPGPQAAFPVMVAVFGAVRAG